MISCYTVPMVLPEYPMDKFDRFGANQRFSSSQEPWHADASHDLNHRHYNDQIADTMPDPHQQFSPHAFDWDVTDRLVANTTAAAPPAAAASVSKKTRPQHTQLQRPDSPKSGPRKRSSSVRDTRPSGSRKTLTPLPNDFEPSNYSVMCGQGNEYFHAIGNRRFRVTVNMFRDRYATTTDRLVKSSLVTQVLDIIYEACPVGAFIKYKDGRWWSVDDKTAREKVGAYFRDSLADSYKSSAKSKIARRRARDKARRASQSTQGSAASGGTLGSAASAVNSNSNTSTTTR